MDINKTDRLAQHIGKHVRVNYNVAQDSSKPSVMFYGKLLAYNRYYEIVVNGGTWIHFTDSDIYGVWDEETPYIELRV